MSLETWVLKPHDPVPVQVDERHVMREWRQFADLDLAPRSAREYSYWVIRFWSDTLVDLLTAIPPRDVLGYLSAIPSRGRQT
jgi:hypothetical protein